MEIIWAVSSLGLPWLTARYLPELRLQASGPVIAAQTGRIFLWTALSLSAFLLAGFAFVEPFLNWVGLTQHLTEARVYLLVIAIEGAGRHLRESFLGPLMQQGLARLSLVLRQALFLTLTAMAFLFAPANLATVVIAELGASIVGTGVGLVALRLHLGSLQAQEGRTGWQPPPLSAMWRTAVQMYVAHVLAMVCSPHTFVMLIQRFQGSEAAALLGFVRSLYDIAVRYLPATVLFSIIRPRLVASYVHTGGVSELASQVNLLGKLSLFVLLPLIVVVAIEGDPITYLLSGGKFSASGWLLFGMMVGLLPLSQRRLLETVAVTMDRGGICTLASASGLLMLPLMLWLTVEGWGVWAAVAAIVLGQWLFNIIVLGGLAISTDYRSDLLGAFKLMLAALFGYGVVLLPPLGAVAWMDVGITAVLSTAIYLLVAYFLKPFTNLERDRVNQLIKREVFVW